MLMNNTIPRQQQTDIIVGQIRINCLFALQILKKERKKEMNENIVIE